jgi:signal transduction histidine kinase
MRLRTPDLAALALGIVAFALAWSTWLSGGSIDLGLTLGESNGTIVVASVSPDGLASRVGIVAGSEVLALAPLSEDQLKPAEKLPTPDGESAPPFDGQVLQQPKVAPPQSQIQYISAGDVFRDDQGRLQGWNGPDLYRDIARAAFNQSLAVLLIGGLLAFVIWRVVSSGHFGDAWRRAALPLAAASTVPLMVIPMYLTGTQFGIAAWLILPALAMLPFASVLASLQPSPERRRAWFMASWMLAAGVVYITVARHLGTADDAMAGLRYPMLAGIVGVPAIGALRSVRGGRERLDESSVPTARMEVVTVGLTPIVALAVWMPASAGAMLPLFLAWLIIVALASRFTVTPLVQFVQRTQRQRDLVVAASEAERARLAADLHDDALQDLISLVRRLDMQGDSEGAEMARHVAERLRAICSDLRLPLLDDLGAGAALEWLVSRVAPLAGGSVQLERADRSRPPSNVELAVFRVAQEAVSNAVRHGSAPITVRYHVTDAGRVSLSIEDAGPGIDLDQAETAQQNGHFGLANMQQRAEQIGALLNVGRWPGGGTHVGLEWKPS